MSASMDLIERLRKADPQSAQRAVGSSILGEAADEIGRLRAAQAQIRGFAKVMDENNWRDLKLHIERQCAVEQSAER